MSKMPNPLEAMVMEVVMKPQVVAYSLIRTLFPQVFAYRHNAMLKGLDGNTTVEDLPSDRDAYVMLQGIFGGMIADDDNADACWATITRIIIAKALAGEEVKVPNVPAAGNA